MRTWVCLRLQRPLPVSSHADVARKSLEASSGATMGAATVGSPTWTAAAATATHATPVAHAPPARTAPPADATPVCAPSRHRPATMARAMATRQTWIVAVRATYCATPDRFVKVPTTAFQVFAERVIALRLRA